MSATVRVATRIPGSISLPAATNASTSCSGGTPRTRMSETASVPEQQELTALSNWSGVVPRRSSIRLNAMACASPFATRSSPRTTCGLAPPQLTRIGISCWSSVSGAGVGAGVGVAPGARDGIGTTDGVGSTEGLGGRDCLASSFGVGVHDDAATGPGVSRSTALGRTRPAPGSRPR